MKQPVMRPFFFLRCWLGMIAHAKRGPDTVDLAHTHLEVEALSEGYLQG